MTSKTMRMRTTTIRMRTILRTKMTNKLPDRLENVTVLLKANVYFGGKVVSHTLLMQNGTKKTAGLIYPGEFTFNTDAAEQMDILNGRCEVRIKGEASWAGYAT